MIITIFLIQLLQENSICLNFLEVHAEQNRNPREITQDLPRVPTQRRRSLGEDEDAHKRSNSAPSRKVEVGTKCLTQFVFEAGIHVVKSSEFTVFY